MDNLLRAPKVSFTTFAALLSFLATSQVVLADPDENLRAITEVARKLEFSRPENRAFILVKRGFVYSPVGLIFGYMDNEAACEELALALNRPNQNVGSFECLGVR